MDLLLYCDGWELGDAKHVVDGLLEFRLKPHSCGD